MLAHAAKGDRFILAAASDLRAKHPRWERPGSVQHLWPVGGLLKRSIDVAFALLAMVLLAPLTVLVAIVLRSGLGRPILVAEDRIGFGGRQFTAYRFRTAPIHRAGKLASDSTIATCLGTVRDARLDRLPQLLCILRGDMSVVGPRVIALDELDHPGGCAPDYFKARPGLVGLRPADRPGHRGSRESAVLDRYYVRRWSMWLDLVLLARAIAAIRSGNDGA
jgi:exopolysaccharide production protein ExoY